MNAGTPLDETNDVLVAAERWMGEGRELAIVTIIAAKSGADLLAGHRMIIDASGAALAKAFASGNGGIVETAGRSFFLDVHVPRLPEGGGG